LKLLVATRSRHKVGEIRDILSDVPDLELIDLDQAGIAETAAEDELEPYETFEENARSKASWFQRLSGLPTVADDSGIVVDALGGQPGVRSRRFAPMPEGTGREEQDRANNRHLMKLLAGVPPERRTARYVCVAALVQPDGREAVFRGSVEGVVVDQPKGEGGFGYDPYFVVPELGHSFGEAAA
jgi:XTP/dITP diphosphohydrolase